MWTCYEPFFPFRLLRGLGSMGPTEPQPLPPGLALALEADDLSGWPLLAAGCGPSLFSWTDNEGHVQARSLLSLACYYGAEECVATLLGLPSGRASASEPSPTDGSTPLHCACSRPCDATYRILTRLIASGAGCDARDGTGRRAGELLIQSKVRVACGLSNVPRSRLLTHLYYLASTDA